MYILYQIRNPILIISWVENIKFIQEFKKTVVMYDYLDDISVAEETPSKQTIRNHRNLLKKADLLLVTADMLKKNAEEIRKDIIVLPNAGDYLTFHLAKNPPLPADLKSILKNKKPIVGYYGAMAKWFDYDLVKSVAKLRPDYQFLLIGPNYDHSLENHNLDKIKNIFWLGLKNYHDLPKYLYYFDVAMIPFVVNDITKATSPVKIFEYMAGGKLTVSTPLDECKKYKSVLIGEGVEDFINKLDQAIKLKDDPKILAMIDKEAKENTWEKRIDLLEKELERILGGNN